MSGGAGAPFMGMRPAKDAGPPTRSSMNYEHLSEAA
jgi:hypothetical protein